MTGSFSMTRTRLMPRFLQRTAAVKPAEPLPTMMTSNVSSHLGADGDAVAAKEGAPSAAAPKAAADKLRRCKPLT